MPDLSTLTTLIDLERAGWSLKLKCLNCSGEGELSWPVVRNKLKDDLNISLANLDRNRVAWFLKPICSRCRVRGQAELVYVSPMPLDGAG